VLIECPIDDLTNSSMNVLHHTKYWPTIIKDRARFIKADFMLDLI